MNSITSFLRFTGEAPSDFADNHLLTLDCSIFVSNGQFLHSFFEKSMRTSKCLDAASALPEITVKYSLRQEIIRLLINLHFDIPLSDKIDVLDNFYMKMMKSVHKHEFARMIFIEALLKFDQMVKNSKLCPNDPQFRPIYLFN